MAFLLSMAKASNGPGPLYFCSGWDVDPWVDDKVLMRS